MLVVGNNIYNYSWHQYWKCKLTIETVARLGHHCRISIVCQGNLDCIRRELQSLLMKLYSLYKSNQAHMSILSMSTSQNLRNRNDIRS